MVFGDLLVLCLLSKPLALCVYKPLLFYKNVNDATLTPNPQYTNVGKSHCIYLRPEVKNVHYLFFISNLISLL